ncbi:BlaI/MecI/CopY family transcriptional regulator [Streptomyces sp. VRA16 Mangrove soil]|uniref:BlaI/MecI/CopY family transcriptional regulator n=1 Tax=Streptomyces sp. VRA16 Mangrove soil TaxID=2817434 RepID=UPI001A9D1948|nr:BlaI/MecI/CopY family transcriptional regulator [Streptomyces sp. VRA16 Mangrove soil]MBO1330409.1 BlaI/MecI/CopY family transcriptional regulator [Streptomyces sp. VRA16 Mangrove soil]
MTEQHGERRPAGELEADVLAALWAARGPLTPNEVRDMLTAALARTTVTTILTRLYEKDLVTRTRKGRGYAYAPVTDGAGLHARRMHAELNRGEDRGSVLARFVSDLAPEDEAVLRSLLESEGPTQP